MRVGDIATVKHGELEQLGLVTAVNTDDEGVETADVYVFPGPTYAGVPCFGSVDEFEAVPDEDKAAGKRGLRPGVAVVGLDGHAAQATPAPAPEVDSRDAQIAELEAELARLRAAQTPA
jgi:hypothetical protein